MSVSKQGGPVKSTLQNFCSCLFSTEMATTGMIMTEGDNIGLGMLRYVSPNDLIGTILKQIRIIPKKIFHHGQKFEFILSPPMQRHLAGDKIVHYVSESWYRILSNVHQLLIRESLRNGDGVLGVAHSQSRQMIRHHIFGTLFIPNFNVELLKKQNPPDKTRFSIFFRKKILQCSMIRVDDDFRSYK
jgi:hypothetical protein